MFSKIYLSLIIIYLSMNGCLANSKIYIYATVDDEIITNFDIQKESEYLKILNTNLEQLESKQVFKLAKDSLINEIIKKKEISKFIDIDNKDNALVDEYLQNLFSKLNYSDLDSFKKALSTKGNYSISTIKKKIKLELMWNELIYNRYKNQVKIDENEIIKKVNNLSNKTQKEFLLSEIVFAKKKGENLDDLFDQISLSIDQIGFNNTANIYSISDSSKLGGKIGWINESSLSKIILKELNNITKGEFTKKIKIANNYLILKIDDVKFDRVIIDKDIEIKNLIRVESNKQLNQFSRIYFDKSKINYSINEN